MSYGTAHLRLAGVPCDLTVSLGLEGPSAWLSRWSQHSNFHLTFWHAWQGRNVLKKEPMSKEVEENDIFVFNESFTSKFYKVKIGVVSAQKESEPEKQETRLKVWRRHYAASRATDAWRCMLPSM